MLWRLTEDRNLNYCRQFVLVWFCSFAILIFNLVSERLDPTATEMCAFEMQIPRLVTTNSAAAVQQALSQQSAVCSSAHCAVGTYSTNSVQLAAVCSPEFSKHSVGSLSQLKAVCLVYLCQFTQLLPLTTEHNAQTHDTHYRFLLLTPVTSRVSVTIGDTEDLTVGGAVAVLATDRHWNLSRAKWFQSTLSLPVSVILIAVF